jgi:CubicO group peptidase (beta-lactamase class C family)
MTRTTFDFSQAMSGNFASPHGADVDGKTWPARMDHNYSAVPFRPAGGIWTSARDLSRYVAMELARGALPGGKHLVSEENLLERRRAQVPVGEDAIYGLGLGVSTKYGIPVVNHFARRTVRQFLTSTNGIAQSPRAGTTTDDIFHSDRPHGDRFQFRGRRARW